MNLLPSHQRNESLNLFGLLSSRFLYQIPKASAERQHKTPDDNVSQTIKEEQEKHERFITAITSQIKDYNEKYGEEPSEGGEDAHYEKLILDFANLSALDKQIAEIVRKKKEKAGKSWKKTLANDPQYKALMNFVRIIKAYQEVSAQSPESEREARRARLNRRNKQMTEALDRKEAWGKKPLHKELNGIFENLAESEKFKGAFQSPDGLSTESQREARQLFMAIMAEKTHGFTDSFVLGNSFQNDAAANIRNFPFIYNEFLRHEGARITGEAVSPEAIAAAESAATEANRKLIGVDKAEVIVARNSGAGLNPVPPIPTIPDTSKWEERLKVLIGNAYNLEERAKTETDLPLKAGWVRSAKELRVHVDYARTYLKLSRLKDREKTVQSRFTRIELSHPNRRKMVMEWAMKKFMKAKEMVDKGPYGNTNWQGTLHPTVRRMLIANIYDTGVARYQKDANGKVTYEENIKGENTWMLSALALSDYFNFKEKGEKMDPDHEAILKAAWLGSKVAGVIENLQPSEDVLEAWLDVHENAPKITDKAKRKAYIERRMAKFPPELVTRFKTYDESRLKTTLDQVQKSKKTLIDFTEAAREAIKDPYSVKSKEFIADMKSGVYAERLSDEIDDLGNMGIIDKISLEQYQRQMFDLQINFKTAELQEGNTQMFFEELGINIEGIFPKYLSMIRKNPKLNADYWDHLLLGSDAEFNSLKGLMQIILADSTAGGKKDFIAGLDSIRRKYKGKKSMTEILGSLEEGSEDAVVLNVLRMLKLHLTDRGNTAAYSDRQAKEIDAKLRGMNIGDKISKYVGGVWEMLTGPGQSMANRAAGLVLMYGLIKSARMAMKGDTKTAKMMRALFVAGAVEIAAKEITGRGILDRVGMDSIAGAMEGTYEEVLRQDGEEHMEDKNITPEAHGAALTELNDVPFHKIMEWYESSDPNGMPQPPGSKDKLPRQIDLKRIAPKVTWKTKDKDREARHVVYETVKHFFGYVGGKANKRDAVYAKEALKERWIKMYDDPNYKPKYTTYNHLEWFKSGAVKKSDITWQMVMRCEIDPKKVDLTKNKTHVGILWATTKEWYEDIATWAHEHVYNPGSGDAEVFFDSMGENAQDAKKFLGQVYETSKRKVYFGKEKVVLWYGEHEYEIRRTAKNHWDLFVIGVTFPFKAILAGDNWAIPWSLTKLKQIEVSLQNSQVEPISDRDDFDPRYIIEQDKYMLGLLDSPNIELNPRFSHFGLMQGDFLNAMAPIKYDANGRVVELAPGLPDRINALRGNWFYKDPGENIGYFISEVNYADAHINTSDPKFASMESKNSALIIASREKARQRFRNEGMSFKEIDKYMYSVHKIVFTKSGKMYSFWRMPLKNSAELYLKESGGWADYMDINRYKEREAFMRNPSQTKWENLKRALTLDMDPVRKILTGVGGYAAQIPRIMFAHIKVIGDIIKFFGKKAGPDFKKMVDAITVRPPATKILVDEFFTSAKNKDLAISKFYQDKTNAKLYKFSLEFCQNSATPQPLYLGLLEGRKGYEGRHMYLDNPNKKKTFADMETYYKNYYVAAGKPDKDIAAAISKKRKATP